MKLNLKWNGAMNFMAESDGVAVPMDAKAPLGNGAGMTPKQLLLAGLAGCTAMDVIALFKKYKQIPDSFLIDVEVEPTQTGHPVVFKNAILNFQVEGNVAKDKFIEAVTLSQTKYCGVSAMLSKAFPIHFKLVLNGELIYEGDSHF